MFGTDAVSTGNGATVSTRVNAACRTEDAASANAAARAVAGKQTA